MSQMLLESTYATPEGIETETICGCCSTRVCSGLGWLESDHTEIAAYWYEWPEGHAGRFYIAIARFEEGILVPGVAAIAGAVGTESVSFTALDPKESPWPDFGDFGLPLSRNQVLADSRRVFDLADAISAKDHRIASRIVTIKG